ncbi:unnamed protein product [Auanema sp. JU1783]|nr:unnamed protein product [Auanema sp. JU1783]
MSEQESKPDSGVKPMQKFSIFTGIQYGTTAAATLLFIRACTNRFLTHRQRGSNVIGSIGFKTIKAQN